MENSVCEVTQGAKELLQQALIWLTDRGLDLAADVLMALVIFFVGWGVISILKKALNLAIKNRLEKSPLMARFVVSVLTKVAWAFLLVTVLAKLGVNVGPLVAGLGVTGFILGFAFQESLANLAAGLMIAINQPFQVGDRVKAAGFEGTVKEVNMMATVLTAADNQRIVIPNKGVWGGPIVNFSAK